MKIGIRRALPALAVAAFVAATLFACTWGKTDEAEAQTSTASHAFTFKIQAGTFFLRAVNTPIVQTDGNTTRYDLTSDASLEFGSSQPLPAFPSPISLRDGDIVLERPTDNNVTVMRRIP